MQSNSSENDNYVVELSKSVKDLSEKIANYK